MDYAYDQKVRDTALLEGETVLQLLRPGKKAFNVYRIAIPCALLACVWAGFLAYTLQLWRRYDLPISVGFYAAGTILTLALVLLIIAVQKKRLAKTAYYVTDRRVLLVGGLFHLKYRTLHYRFIGSAELSRVPFSKALGLDAFKIHLILNVHKRLTVSFFSVAGTSLSLLENASDAYKRIVELSSEK